MTGAPIYLVSACTSGEEFVAAFRRYADKNGLFVPIGEPLPVGARARFAVTLADGGVMLEGEAEVTTAARTPSVLHGRIGMTLRFVAPDAPSKTLLGELAMARLAMRPAPPSVAPRPAEIPAEPRPVPPPVAGRIDATNALAECVVIGDVSGFGTPSQAMPAMTPSGVPVAAAPATAAATAKSGARFVVPTVPTLPGGAKRAATVAGTPAAPASAAAAPASPSPSAPPIPSRTSTAQRPLEIPPPTLTPRATPIPDELRKAERRSDVQPVVAPNISGFSKTMTAVALDPGPTSDTYVAAVPPPPDAAHATNGAAHGPANGAAAPGGASDDLSTTLTDPPSKTASPAIAVARTSTASKAAVAASEPARPRTTSDTLVSGTPPTAPPTRGSAPRYAVEMAAARPGPGEGASDAQILIPSELALEGAAAAPVATASVADAPAPPAPATPERDAIVSTTMTAIPLSSAALQSAPTEIGGVIVEPLPPLDAEPAPVSDAAIPLAAITANDEPSARTQIHAGAPRPEPGSAPTPAARPSAHTPIDLTQTLTSRPPDMADHQTAKPTRSAVPTSPLPGALTPAPPVVAEPRPPLPEVEIAEPTDLSIGPPQPTGPALEPDESTSPDAVMARAPRKTVIGVAVVPSGSHVPPASAAPVIEPVSEAASDAANAASGVAARAAAARHGAANPSRAIEQVEISLDASLDLAADDPALAADGEPTGADRVVDADAVGAAEPKPNPAATTMSASPAPIPSKPAGTKSTGGAPAIAAARTPVTGSPAIAPPPSPLASATPPAVPRAKTPSVAGAPIPRAKTPSVAGAPIPRAKTPSVAGAPIARAKTPSTAGAPIAAAPAPEINRGDWIMPQAKLAGLVAPGQELPPTAAVPAAAAPSPEPPVAAPSGAPLPSGDWTIALDPQAPDGWSEPFETIPAPLVEPEDLPGIDPMIASDEPLDSMPSRRTVERDALPIAEPKVQIDPTLIQPLRPMPSDGPLRAMPADNPFRRAASSAEEIVAEPPTFETPALHPGDSAGMAQPIGQPISQPVGMAMAQSMPHLPQMPAMHGMAPGMAPMQSPVPPSPFGPPIAGQAPAYPMDPSYQMVAVGSMPRAATAGGSDARFATDTIRPVANRRRRIIIVVISAVVAAVIGIVVLARLTRGASPAPEAAPTAPLSHPPASPPAAPSDPAVSPHPAPAATHPAAPTKTSALPQGTVPHAAQGATFAAASGTTDRDDADPPPAPPPPRPAVATRPAHPLFQVKVSSMPAGATITLNGKSLGVTPTIVLIPAFQASALSLTKDGYAVETERVTPKANGIAVHSVLKKLGHKPH